MARTRRFVACLATLAWTAAGGLVLPALGAERELAQDPAHASAPEIRASIERIITEAPERRPALLPWFREPL